MDPLEVAIISPQSEKNSNLSDLVSESQYIQTRTYYQTVDELRTQDPTIDCILFSTDIQPPEVKKLTREFQFVPLILYFQDIDATIDLQDYLDVGVDDIFELTSNTTATIFDNTLITAVQSDQFSESSEMLERLTDAYFSLDTQYRFRKYNQKGFELLQSASHKDLSPETLYGECLWDIVPKIIGTAFEEKYIKAMENNEHQEFTEYYSPLDIWAHINVYPSESGLSILIQDVTEKKRLELEKEKNLEVLFSLYDLASNAELSHRERIEEAISLGRNMLDLSYGFVTKIENNEQLIMISQNITDHPDLSEGAACPIDETYCQHILDQAEPLTVENASREGWTNTPEYQRFHLESYISQKLIVEGEVYGTLCFADDSEKQGSFTETELAITELLSGWVSYELERKHTYERLQQKNEQLEAFAGFVSHDLRNPLSIAQGYLDMELQQNDSEHLKKVQHAHDRMDGLITNLLDLTTSSNIISETEPVSLSEISQDAWSHIQTQNAELLLETEKTISANYDKLLNVFENLFKNSIEHNSDPVTVTVGETESGFYIQDNGSGIEEENIFEYGVSGSDSTGLGLSIVQRIIEAHNWKISLDNTYTDGARFIITTHD